MRLPVELECGAYYNAVEIVDYRRWDSAPYVEYCGLDGGGWVSFSGDLSNRSQKWVYKRLTC
jgi:hypothetical protein